MTGRLRSHWTPLHRGFLVRGLIRKGLNPFFAGGLVSLRRPRPQFPRLRSHLKSRRRFLRAGHCAEFFHLRSNQRGFTYLRCCSPWNPILFPLLPLLPANGLSCRISVLKQAELALSPPPDSTPRPSARLLISTARRSPPSTGGTYWDKFFSTCAYPELFLVSSFLFAIIFLPTTSSLPRMSWHLLQLVADG